MPATHPGAPGNLGGRLALGRTADTRADGWHSGLGGGRGGEYGSAHGRSARSLRPHHRLGTRRSAGESRHQRAQRGRRRSGDGRELQPLGRGRHRRRAGGLRRVARRTGQAVVEAIRRWRTEPIRHLVYTHGHADHVGGSEFFAADRRSAAPVIGHENVRHALRPLHVHQRLEPAHQRPPVRRHRRRPRADHRRRRQRRRPGHHPTTAPVHPDRHAASRSTRSASRPCRSADTTVELHHARGETDDHIWAWIPERSGVMTGDFVIWNFPNAGNPQKVQRYPIEWAAALREMIAHGARAAAARPRPADRRRRADRPVLDDIATALEDLVADVLALMNAGRHARRDRAHACRCPTTPARPPVPAADLRRARVRGAQRLAALRRLVGRRPGPRSSRRPTPRWRRAGDARRRRRRARAPRRAGARAAATMRLACHLVDLAGVGGARRSG